VDQQSKKRPVAPAQPAPERRRIGRVVHDERGNASVSWRDAPEDYERPVLELLTDPKLTVKSEETFNPYARGGIRREMPRTSGGTARTDLRKLSEHIKMMRALQERQRHGDAEED